MDWLTFFSNLIDSTAWPVATVSLVFILRKQITTLLPNVRKLKAGPVEAEFERGVKAIEAEVMASPQADRAIATAEAPADRLFDLATISPRAAILEAWQAVEFTARRVVLQHCGSPVPDMSSPMRVVRALSELALLPPEDIALFHDLRGLRNQATHSPDFAPSLDSVSRYLHLAAGLERRLAQHAGIES
jgi:hypothetical protein